MFIFPKKVQDACTELFEEIWSLEPGLKDKAALTVITSLVAYSEKINDKSLASSTTDRNQAKPKPPTIERRDDDVQITLSAQIFGPIKVLCLDSDEQMVLKPEEIRCFLKVCRGISHSDLARGHCQDGLISQADWQRWMKTSDLKAEMNARLRRAKELNTEIEEQNELNERRLAELRREIEEATKSITKRTEPTESD